MIGYHEALLNCGGKYQATKGSDTCTPLPNINKHYITSNITLKQVKIDTYITIIDFKKVITKYDFNNYKIGSCFIMTIKSLICSFFLITYTKN